MAAPAAGWSAKSPSVSESSAAASLPRRGACWEDLLVLIPHSLHSLYGLVLKVLFLRRTKSKNSLPQLQRILFGVTAVVAAGVLGGGGVCCCCC